MKELSEKTKPERSNIMAEVVNHIYQFKRGTAQRWIEVNPILRQGEPGFEYDTGKLKIGDGFTPWLALPYINNDGGEISGQEEMVTVSTYSELPKIGDEKKLYRVVEDKLLYQWNFHKGIYESLGATGSFDPTIITLINGGNANG